MIDSQAILNFSKYQLFYDKKWALRQTAPIDHALVHGEYNVMVNHFSQCLCPYKICTLSTLQVKEATQRAISICHRVGKPNETDRKVLNKLYPACNSRSRTSFPQKRKFDPLDESIAETKKAKKKAAIPKAAKCVP